MLAKHPILFLKVLDDILLLPIQPSCQRHHNNLPGMSIMIVILLSQNAVGQAQSIARCCPVSLSVNIVYNAVGFGDHTGRNLLTYRQKCLDCELHDMLCSASAMQHC